VAAWSHSNELTPCGKQEYKEVFDGINYHDFTINLKDCGNDCWEFSVLRKVAGGRMTNTVTIPKVATKGSYFGRCTCGLAQPDAIPCKHMAAVEVSSQIPALSQTNIMPFWWTHAQWQLQHGKDVLVECYANMEVVRAEFESDERNRYCPVWSAPNKAGRPPKGKFRKSILEQATGKRSKGRPLTTFCQLCLKYSHCTVDCWVQEKNKEHRPLNWKDTCNEANNDLMATNAALVDDTLGRTTGTLPLAQNDVVVKEGKQTRTSGFVSIQNRNKLDLWTIIVIPYTMNSFLMANNLAGGALLGKTTVGTVSRRIMSKFVTTHALCNDLSIFSGTTVQGKYLTSNTVAGWGTVQYYMKWGCNLKYQQEEGKRD
jgi:hypothetical protein